LFEQGIIAPVNETEDLLISSPIVLVSKRSKNAGKPSAQDFRFCCDYRFLNSQTREFKYTMPDLQELTESFSEIIPNFISSIDLSSGFFQMVFLVSSPLSIHVSRLTNFTTSHGPQNCAEYISITYGQGLTRVKIQILFMLFGRRLDLFGNI
jgi:hypothetical protein